jgi:hypothetical protein
VTTPRYPSLYQINTRVWLTELSGTLGQARHAGTISRTSNWTLLIVVNYAPNHSHCYVRLPFPKLGDQQWRLEDMLSDARYNRNGRDLESHGLYLDMAPWSYHVFQIWDL